MSEMVERVARAIAASECSLDGYGDSENWEIFVDTARAAIAAMRVPTEAMEHVVCGHSITQGAIWRRMIDTALEESA